LIDLRRRPKRRASDATPRMLPRFRRGLQAVGLEGESAVAGRESGTPRVDLVEKGTVSSSARELSEIIPEEVSTDGWRSGRDYTRYGKRGSPKDPDSSGSKTSRSLPLELDLAAAAMENVRVRGTPVLQESTGLAGF
jgi:hypothetical protein